MIMVEDDVRSTARGVLFLDLDQVIVGETPMQSMCARSCTVQRGTRMILHLFTLGHVAQGCECAANQEPPAQVADRYWNQHLCPQFKKALGTARLSSEAFWKLLWLFWRGWRGCGS